MLPFQRSQKIKQLALDIGFSACGITRIEPADKASLVMEQWVLEGKHAGMEYLAKNQNIRSNPALLLDGAQSIVCVALNYFPKQQQPPNAPQIATYAYGRDYHKVLKKKLQKLYALLCEEFGSFGARAFTDSAPILERYWAHRAGIGTIGKSGQLIIPGKGSYFFLGELIVDLELEPDEPAPEDICGKCMRCINSCPTKALTGTRQLDANRCLSYLTIEYKGAIPEEFASKMGKRLFGCDTCVAVCPHNRRSVPSDVEDFQIKPPILNLSREDLLDLDEERYHRLFDGSAATRAGFEGMARNAAIYLKNNPLKNEDSEIEDSLV